MKLLAAISISLSFAAPVSTNDAVGNATPAVAVRRSSQDMIAESISAETSSADPAVAVESSEMISEQMEKEMNDLLVDLDDVIQELGDTVLADFFKILEDNFDDILDDGQLGEVADFVENALNFTV